MSKSPENHFLAGGGEMGALMRAKDWSATPLGPVEAWPQSLRSAVSILLPSKAQIVLFWGPQLVTLYNDAYRPVYGAKHPRVLGLPAREAWSEIWQDVLGELFGGVLRTGEAFWGRDLPFTLERNGFPEETFFDVSYDPVRDESGAVGGIFCIVSETTGRVIGERRLKVLRDLAAVPTQARTAQEALQRSLAVLAASPADVARAEAKDDGSILLVPSPRLPFDEDYRAFFDLVNSQVSASLAAVRAAEEERRRAAALAEIDRAKTAFFSNVSHEFRTPLTLMLGPIADGLQDASAPLPAAQRERLELAHRSGLRLQKLVNTLLDFARIEAGRAQASYQATDLGRLTADLASSFRSAIEKAGLKLEVDCSAPAEPAFVDRDMWEKVVLNLLSNALKFTFEGTIRVALALRDGRHELSVQDSGTGIPASELPHLFERFRRVEGARSRTHEGSGIGLALVQELVRLHGGEIAVRSVEGEGSTFTVCIPAGRAHLPAERVNAPAALAPTTLGAAPFVEEAMRWLPDERPHPASAASAARARIVWADDNADMREYVRRLLAPLYEVEAVADGQAALEAIRASTPDLVLADVMMPRVDGFGLLAALRGERATRDLPVLLLSARAGEEARVEALEAGADDYVVKPFGARELLARVAARLELSRMHARMRQEQEDLDRLFAQVPVPTAVLRGPQLVFELCNASYIEVIGGRDIVGKPFAEALPDLRGQGFGELLRKVMRTGAPHVGRETLVRLQRNGRVEDVYFTFIYAPLRSADGEVDRVIVVCNDVTQQVRARDEIQALAGAAAESARELQEFIEEATVAMHWVGPDGTILWANQAELDMLGYPREEYIGRNIVEFHAQRDVIDDILKRLFCDERLSNYEATLRRKDGTLRHVLINSSVKWRHGEFVHTRCFTRDITERKLAEQALSDEARRKDEFLAILSHELRNPLAPIRNAVTALRAAPHDAEVRGQALPVLDRQVGHLIRLVDDLLDVARISRGEIALQKEVVGLEEIVSAALETSRPRIDERGHRLVVAAGASGAAVFGDRVRLAQIVSNLLNNAAAYTPEGGRIEISVRTEQDQGVIRVRDNGAGIPAESAQSLFGLFTRGQSARTHSAGFGVGLALARRLAEMHGGTIEGSSPGAGLGSEFVVRLPLTERPGVAPTVRAQSVPGKRILVVDDNQDAADSLGLVLRLLGAEVRVAHDGPAAIAAVESDPPSVVLLDIGMPGMNGYEVAREIRLRCPKRRPALVALTGWGNEEDRRRTREAGFDHHLVKPANIEALEALLGELSRTV